MEDPHLKSELSHLLERFVERAGQPVSRIAAQAQLPKQTLFNWLGGRTPRFHAELPSDIERLSRALGLDSQGRDSLLLAAGCLCALDTPPFQEKTMTELPMPTGWIRAGSHPKDYSMGIDPEVLYGQLPAAAIISAAPKINGFGTLMQSCNPGDFLEKRVCFSAAVRTADVEDWAGLWFRVDGTPKQRMLAFDNMQNRSLKGTTGWERHSIVLDVEADASNLAYGALLSGTGKVWLAEARIEVVSLDVPCTNISGSPDGPVNLDFAEQS